MTTPSQTVGPFFAVAFDDPQTRFVVPEDAPDAIRIFGRVLDGAGEPVPDALVETWQSAGFGRCATDADGRYEIATVRAPHIAVSVFARGLLQRAVTRIYFEDDDADEVLRSLPADARATLIAEPTEDGYRFDVHLQGERETAFFAL